MKMNILGIDGTLEGLKRGAERFGTRVAAAVVRRVGQRINAEQILRPDHRLYRDALKIALDTHNDHVKGLIESLDPKKLSPADIEMLQDVIKSGDQRSNGFSPKEEEPYGLGLGGAETGQGSRDNAAEPAKDRNGRHGYIGYCKGKQYEVYADSAYGAVKKLAAQIGKKESDVSVELAEKDVNPETGKGTQVTTLMDNAGSKTVTIRGDEYEVAVVDPTHVTMKLVGGSGTPWALHVAQLDDETVRQLQAAGIMDERRYVKNSLGNAAGQGWDVFLRGEKIDTVFYDADVDADYVKRGLVGHDGYDAAIEVRKSAHKNDGEGGGDAGGAAAPSGAVDSASLGYQSEQRTTTAARGKRKDELGNAKCPDDWCDGSGMIVARDGRGRRVVEACDFCGKYSDDDDAAAAYEKIHGKLNNADSSKVVDFECVKCGHRFETGVTYEDFDPRAYPKCPKCGGADILDNSMKSKCQACGLESAKEWTGKCEGCGVENEKSVGDAADLKNSSCCVCGSGEDHTVCANPKCDRTLCDECKDDYRQGGKRFCPDCQKRPKENAGRSLQDYKGYKLFSGSHSTNDPAPYWAEKGGEVIFEGMDVAYVKEQIDKKSTSKENATLSRAEYDALFRKLDAAQKRGDITQSQQEAQLDAAWDRMSRADQASYENASAVCSRCKGRGGEPGGGEQQPCSACGGAGKLENADDHCQRCGKDTLDLQPVTLEDGRSGVVCRDCKGQIDAREKRNAMFTFVDGAGETEEVEAADEASAWRGLATVMATSVEEMRKMGVRLQNSKLDMSDAIDAVKAGWEAMPESPNPSDAWVGGAVRRALGSGGSSAVREALKGLRDVLSRGGENHSLVARLDEQLRGLENSIKSNATGDCPDCCDALRDPKSVSDAYGDVHREVRERGHGGQRHLEVEVGGKWEPYCASYQNSLSNDLANAPGSVYWDSMSVGDRSIWLGLAGIGDLAKGLAQLTWSQLPVRERDMVARAASEHRDNVIFQNEKRNAGDVASMSDKEIDDEMAELILASNRGPSRGKSMGESKPRFDALYDEKARRRRKGLSNAGSAFQEGDMVQDNDGVKGRVTGVAAGMATVKWETGETTDIPAKEGTIKLVNGSLSNAGHLGAETWIAASLDERCSWLESAGMDINLATEPFNGLSEDVKVALQDRMDKPVSRNNLGALAAKAQHGAPSAELVRPLLNSSDPLCGRSGCGHLATGHASQGTSSGCLAEGCGCSSFVGRGDRRNAGHEAMKKDCACGHQGDEHFLEAGVLMKCGECSCQKFKNGHEKKNAPGFSDSSEQVKAAKAQVEAARQREAEAGTPEAKRQAGALVVAALKALSAAQKKEMDEIGIQSKPLGNASIPVDCGGVRGRSHDWAKIAGGGGEYSFRCQRCGTQTASTTGRLNASDAELARAWDMHGDDMLEGDAMGDVATADINTGKAHPLAQQPQRVRDWWKEIYEDAHENEKTNSNQDDARSMYGVRFRKGMSSTPGQKFFKTEEARDKWVEANQGDIEVDSYTDPERSNKNASGDKARYAMERDALKDHLGRLTAELHQIEGQDGAHSHDNDPEVKKILARMKEVEHAISLAHGDYLEAHERGNADAELDNAGGCSDCGHDYDSHGGSVDLLDPKTGKKVRTLHCVGGRFNLDKPETACKCGGWKLPKKNNDKGGDLEEIARHAEGIEHEVEELLGEDAPLLNRLSNGLLSREQFIKAWGAQSGAFRAARLSDVGLPRDLHDAKWEDLPEDIKAKLLAANENNFPSNGLDNAKLPSGWTVVPGADIKDADGERPSWAAAKFHVLDSSTNPVGEGETRQAAIDDAMAGRPLQNKEGDTIKGSDRCSNCPEHTFDQHGREKEGFACKQSGCGCKGFLAEMDNQSPDPRERMNAGVGRGSSKYGARKNYSTEDQQDELDAQVHDGIRRSGKGQQAAKELAAQILRDAKGDLKSYITAHIGNEFDLQHWIENR